HGTPTARAADRAAAQPDLHNLGGLTKIQHLIRNPMPQGAATHEIKDRISGNPNTDELVLHNERTPIAEQANGTNIHPQVRST
ncbi:hypothetical protein RA273_28585, partial [Pseudomonas syringae pv. tagetis]